jgi:hypothetical protein
VLVKQTEAEKIRAFLQSSVLQSLAIFVLVCLVYAGLLLNENYLLQGNNYWSRNYFVYLAYSFLHNHLNLVNPPFSRDLSYFNGKVYMYWPPLGAVLLMPGVCMFGLDLADRWFNVIYAGISALAAFFLCRQLAKFMGWQPSPAFSLCMSLFFAFGTAMPGLCLWLPGGHWYMAQVVSCMMISLSMLAALSFRRHCCSPFVSGFFWALSISSRMHLILAGPFFLYLALLGNDDKFDWRKLALNWQDALCRTCMLLLPVVLVLACLAWYNWARFGNVLDTGISYHKMDERFFADFHRFGFISPHYIWHNVYYTLLRLPCFQNQPFFKEPGAFTDWQEGYSLFFQSPVLLYAFLSLRDWRRNFLIPICWLCIVVLALPILMIMGSGWMQFGARYLFDLVPFLFLLSIIGSRAKLSWTLLALALAAMVVNFWGLTLLKII